MDSETNLQELKELTKKFCDDRDWGKYHDAKNLAIGVVTEGSELLEHFRFKNEKEIEEMFSDKEKKREICEEMSDVLYFIPRMAQRYGIDLATEFRKKMEKNSKRYPVEKSKGLNKKYTEY